MTHDFGLHLTRELGNRFGSPTGDWPASAELVTPFFAIVVNALGGADGAARWFEAARRAHQRVVDADQARTYNFGFAQYLDLETEAHQEIDLPAVMAAWTSTCTSTARCRRARGSVARRRRQRPRNRSRCRAARPGARGKRAAATPR